MTPKRIRQLLQRLLESHQSEDPHHEDMCRLCLDTRAVLGAKPKRSLKPARQRRETKKASKKEQTQEIRAAVMRRAHNNCELCDRSATDLFPLELHHALGRVRVKQSGGNCLALCRGCHRGITNNDPSAAYWLTRQAATFRLLGHLDTAHRLDARRAFVSARGVA